MRTRRRSILNDMNQPRPGVGRASEHSFASLTRPTASAHRLAAMRSAPKGLGRCRSLGKNARPAGAAPSGPLMTAAHLSRLLLSSPRRNKSRIMRAFVALLLTRAASSPRCGSPPRVA